MKTNILKDKIIGGQNDKNEQTRPQEKLADNG